MKKLILFLTAAFCIAAAAAGCSKTNGSDPKDNITFTAVIDEVHENSILVSDVSESTAGAASFDKASVQWTDATAPAIELRAGQKVKITILPQIRESYPVQATLVSIELAE